MLAERPGCAVPYQRFRPERLARDWQELDSEWAVARPDASDAFVMPTSISLIQGVIGVNGLAGIMRA